MHADFPSRLRRHCTICNASQAGRHGFYVIHPSGVAHHSAVCVTECLPGDVITDKAELLTLVYLMTTLMPDVPATTGNLKYTAHGFGTEFSLMFFDEDILHFRRLAKYAAAILENGQFLIPFCQRTLQMGDLCGHRLFAVRRRELILLFASPVVEL